MSLFPLAKASADEAESYASDFSTLTLEYAHGCFTVKQFSHERGYALRVINGNRLGFSSCNSEDGFQGAVDAALRSSAASPEVKYSFPHSQKYPYLRTKNWDIEKLDEKFAMGCAQQVVDAIKEKAEPARVSLSLSFGKEEIENTNGLSASMDGSSCSVYAEAKKGDLFGFTYHSSRFLPKDFGAIGKEAATMATEMQDARALPTGKYTVCFSPYCLSQLVDFLLFHFSSENVRRGVSALSKRKGEMAFSEKLTITDSLSAQASNAWPFDAEGVSAKSITLVEKGKVMDFLFDTYTAARMGEKKDGNCMRHNYSMPPIPSQSNTIIEKGDYPAHLASDYLYVESFHGMHTSNAISGDFGVQADIAFFVRGKGEKFPVTNMLLTGNIFNLFNSITNVGDTQETWDDLIAPRIWFSGVQLVGPK
jgi:predicted Zn-dependent protease